MGHTVGDQAKRSSAKSEKKVVEELTFEKALGHIRENINIGHAVPADRWKMLLVEYDRLLEKLESKERDLENERIAGDALQKRNEELESTVRVMEAQANIPVPDATGDPTDPGADH
ncbi:MAG: hypothetical protein OK457_07835 [Thaumarchaeota archaeon]|nr:hypothetical protein [Nitrososphaerota archaeon]